MCVYIYVCIYIYIYIYIYTHTPLDFFHIADGLSLEFEWQQVSRTLLSIIAVLNAVVWMVSTRLPASKSSNPFINPFSYCIKRTNHNWYNCHLYVPLFFFNSLARSRYLSIFSHSFSFILWSARTAMSTILQILSLCLSLSF